MQAQKLSTFLNNPKCVRVDMHNITAEGHVCQPKKGSHRLEKYLNIQDCLEKSLKIKIA